MAIWVFIRFTPYFLDKLKSYRSLVQKSEELGIDNSALFYSEEPLTGIAERELSEKIKVPDE